MYCALPSVSFIIQVCSYSVNPELYYFKVNVSAVDP